MIFHNRTNEWCSIEKKGGNNTTHKGGKNNAALFGMSGGGWIMLVAGRVVKRVQYDCNTEGGGGGERVRELKPKHEDGNWEPKILNQKMHTA